MEQLMRIDEICSVVAGATKRIAARISWDDCAREPYELFIETHAEFGDSLLPDPNVFLIASIVPAMHFGERRIRIDEPVCPEIVDGTKKVMQILSMWNRSKGMKPVAIESRGERCPGRDGAGRSAFFYSGGVDSLAALRTNRMSFSPDHHRYFKDGILIYGIEQDDRAAFEHLWERSVRVADQAGFVLLPVRTNMYLVYKEEDAKNSYRFWNMEYGGAALAAIAHAFCSRIGDVTIAGNCDPVNLGPWGTHPILDPNFSSRRLTIRHDGVSVSRLEKVRMIAEWELALNSIRVCNQARRYKEQMVNCGRCEKCVRTMLELQAIGRLEGTSSFPIDNVTAELVRARARIRNDFIRSFYNELIPLFEQQGRGDLVRAIESAIRKYDQRHSLWRQQTERLRQKIRRVLSTASGRRPKQSEPCT
jgi:hypothetical protein